MYSFDSRTQEGDSSDNIYFMPIGEIEMEECCCAPSPTKRLRRTKSVSFEPLPDIHWIENKKDFLVDHFVKTNDLWYVPSELHRIRQECMVILQMIMSKKLLDADMQCARGLESRTMQGAQERRKYRKAAFATVMNIQKECAEHQVAPEPEHIASAYQRYSTSRQEEAHQLGLRDERSVRSLRQKDEIEQISQVYYSHWDACQEAAHKLSLLHEDCSVPQYHKADIEQHLTRDYHHHAAACHQAADHWRLLSHKRSRQSGEERTATHQHRGCYESCEEQQQRHYEQCERSFFYKGTPEKSHMGTKMTLQQGGWFQSTPRATDRRTRMPAAA